VDAEMLYAGAVAEGSGGGAGLREPKLSIKIHRSKRGLASILYLGVLRLRPLGRGIMILHEPWKGFIVFAFHGRL
jgi:hypothetical protein